jgi:Amt family ammonium transporter
MVGPRRGFPDALIPPHSPGLTMAGAGMLWFGWFGFNGGSALAAGAPAAMAILATHCAAAAAALTWMAIEWCWAGGKPTSVGIVTGSVAGLATITPASGFVGPMGALAIGAIAGAVCFIATGFIKRRLRIDDTLDVFAVHGVGGMLGSVLVGVFASAGLGGVGYAAGMDMGAQVKEQILAVVVVAAWSMLVSFVLIKALALFVPLRISADDENAGLDLATHGERAYDHG